MARKKNPDYETRVDLLERIRRQKATIEALQAERRNAEALRMANADLRTAVSRLNRELAACRMGTVTGRLADVVRRFRVAIRGDDGELIGGRNRRTALADVDDAAVEALSALEFPGIAGLEKKATKENQQCT